LLSISQRFLHTSHAAGVALIRCGKQQLDIMLQSFMSGVQ